MLAHRSTTDRTSRKAAQAGKTGHQVSSMVPARLSTRRYLWPTSSSLPTSQMDNNLNSSSSSSKTGSVQMLTIVSTTKDLSKEDKAQARETKCLPTPTSTEIHLPSSSTTQRCATAKATILRVSTTGTKSLSRTPTQQLHSFQRTSRTKHSRLTELITVLESPTLAENRLVASNHLIRCKRSNSQLIRTKSEAPLSRATRASESQVHQLRLMNLRKIRITKW